MMRSTIISTVEATATSIRNVTVERNFTATVTAEPSKRWLARHDIVDVLLGSQPLEARQVTVSQMILLQSSTSYALELRRVEPRPIVPQQRYFGW